MSGTHLSGTRGGPSFGAGADTERRTGRDGGMAGWTGAAHHFVPVRLDKTSMERTDAPHDTEHLQLSLSFICFGVPPPLQFSSFLTGFHLGF